MSIKPFFELFDWVWEKKKRRPIKILIVEDEPLDATMLQYCLTARGFESTVANTAEGAMALIKRNSIDVMFVDMRLTFMKGWELVPLIWSTSQHTHIIVTCTLLEDVVRIQSPTFRERRFDGLVSVVCKPVSVALINELIEKLKLGRK